ncbi:MAG: hydroxylamine reductase, partial [Clostridiales bacterium]|nr:hydroxylamine reductase [Clostridiales bacterium]
MSMFCFQCQETARGTGCDNRGVCGKTEEVAKLQDLLIYTLKGISDIVVKGKIDAAKMGDTNYEVLSSLFMTITNANFDDGAIEKQIRKMIAIRDDLRKSVSTGDLHNAATFIVDSRGSMLEKAASVGVLATENEDVRSLREMITYGLKGMAAYAE